MLWWNLLFIQTEAKVQGLFYFWYYLSGASHSHAVEIKNSHLKGNKDCNATNKHLSSIYIYPAIMMSQ